VSRPSQKTIGRGERVLAGIWRLRLPLPWPGVPHCNAWAIAAGGGRGDGTPRRDQGFVLFDTGMHEPGSLGHLGRALEQVGLRLENARLVVVTHAHTDHCGQAGPIADRAGCEIWMHPNHAHLTVAAEDPDVALARRIEVARQSGVPEAPLQDWARSRRGQGMGVAEGLRADRDLVPGVVVETDLGEWAVYETPGHAPSHVCLHQPERRLLISGDHLLGRVSHYYDYGHTPDPVGEFLSSLDRVEPLDARLALPGHGRAFVDVPGHIEANRALVRRRLHATRQALSREPATAFELAPRVYGPMFNETTAVWLFNKLLCYLTHLRREGEATRLEPTESGGPERWALTSPA
jgi:glyoxylase-like metal-dependent hydrolase (beta-lactamase superfamily II)